VKLPRVFVRKDLGGSSKYSIELLRIGGGKVFMTTKFGHGLDDLEVNDRKVDSTFTSRRKASTLVFVGKLQLLLVEILVVQFLEVLSRGELPFRPNECCRVEGVYPRNTSTKE